MLRLGQRSHRADVLIEAIFVIDNNNNNNNNNNNKIVLKNMVEKWHGNSWARVERVDQKTVVGDPIEGSNVEASPSEVTRSICIYLFISFVLLTIQLLNASVCLVGHTIASFVWTVETPLGQFCLLFGQLKLRSASLCPPV